MIREQPQLARHLAAGARGQSPADPDLLHLGREHGVPREVRQLVALCEERDAAYTWPLLPHRRERTQEGGAFSGGAHQERRLLDELAEELRAERSREHRG